MGWTDKDLEAKGLKKNGDGSYAKSATKHAMEAIKNHNKTIYDDTFIPSKGSPTIDPNWINLGGVIIPYKIKPEYKLLIFFNITPMGKPRMTQSDKWNKREVTSRYWAMKEHIIVQAVKNKFVFPESNFHAIFLMEMPESWSKRKKMKMHGQPHRTKPDRDNTEKGLLDALLKDDSAVWDGRTTKIWSMIKGILIYDMG